MKIEKIKVCYGLLILFALFFASCENDSANGSVSINSVWLNMNGVESTQINSCFTGQWIRLEGSGFDGLKEIYCNTVKVPFSPIINTDNYITFQVPASVPIAQEVEDVNARNTIRIVTDQGEYTYKDFKFKDKNKMPGINSVSYTLPKPGDKIYLEGLYLGATTEIYFPGANAEVKATEFNIINDNKIEVTVPAGVGDTSGSIRIVADGDVYYSPGYMFYTKGIFLRTFQEDIMVPGTYSNTKIYSDPSQIAALTGLANNPEYMMAIPEVKKNIAPATSNGVNSNFFKFYAYKGFNNVIANSAGQITKDTKLENLALQFDLYMGSAWNSGAITLKMNKNSNTVNSQYVYHIMPWTATTPHTFENGWKTVTVKFSDFPNLSLGSLESYITTITNNKYEALIGFANYDMNNDGHTPKALTNFQLYIANIRLVPATTPSLVN